MPKVTVVFDVADPETAKILKDLMMTRQLTKEGQEGKVIACADGDALLEVQAYKDMMDEGVKAGIYHTGGSMMNYLKTMLILCRNALIEQNEKGA